MGTKQERYIARRITTKYHLSSLINYSSILFFFAERNFENYRSKEKHIQTFPGKGFILVYD